MIVLPKQNTNKPLYKLILQSGTVCCFAELRKIENLITIVLHPCLLIWPCDFIQGTLFSPLNNNNYLLLLLLPAPPLKTATEAPQHASPHLGHCKAQGEFPNQVACDSIL